MKRTRQIFSAFLCLSLMLTFSACKPNYDDLPDNYHKETDAPYSFVSTYGVQFAPAENGYYFVVDAFLFFMDAESKQAVIVCNRPDCKHEQETNQEEVWKCNGYIGGEDFVQYYENAVYTITGCSTEDDVLDLSVGDQLTKISPDGSNREPIRRVNIENHSLQLHRGYGYYVGDVKGDRKALYRFPLDDPDAKVEAVFESTSIDEDFIPYGDHIYFDADDTDQNFCLFDYCISKNEVQPAAKKYFLSGIFEDQLLVQTGYSAESAMTRESFLMDRKTYEVTPFLSFQMEKADDLFDLTTDGSNLFSAHALYEPFFDETSEVYGIYDFDILNRSGDILHSFRSPKSRVFTFYPGDERFAFMHWWDTKDWCIEVIDKQNQFKTETVFSMDDWGNLSPPTAYYTNSGL